MTLAIWLLYVVGAPIGRFTAGAFGAGFLGFAGLARFGSDIFSALSLGCLILPCFNPVVVNPEVSTAYTVQVMYGFPLMPNEMSRVWSHLRSHCPDLHALLRFLLGSRLSPTAPALGLPYNGVLY